MHSVPSAVWHGIPAPRSEHSDDGTSRSGSVWAGNAYLDSSVHGTTAGPRRSDSWRARVAAGGGDGVDIEAIAGIAAVDIALARGEVARIVARQPARRVGRSNTNADKYKESYFRADQFDTVADGYEFTNLSPNKWTIR